MSARWYVIQEEHGSVEFWPLDRTKSGEKGFTLQVICSGRATHKVSRLAASIFGVDARWHTTLTHGDSMAISCSDPEWDGESDSDLLYVEFRCCRCGRTPRIGLAKWQSAMDGGLNPSTWRAGVVAGEVDVSRLPF